MTEHDHIYGQSFLRQDWPLNRENPECPHHKFCCYGPLVSRGTYAVPARTYINRSMQRPTSSSPRPSLFSQASRDIHWVSTNPSTVSRLGDVGYTCRKGSWRRVLNIADSRGCVRAGIRPVGSTEWLETTERAPLTNPFVRLSAGTFQLLGPQIFTEFESAINEDKKDMGTLQSKLRLVINPPANRIATAFLAGPYITVRALEVPKSILTEWLRVHHSKLRKATRETMKIWPAENGRLSVSLCLIEFVTESWRTIIIKSVANPSPVVVVWNNGPQDGYGEWKVSEMPGSPSKVTGGLGSAQVLSFICIFLTQSGTRWIIGSDGIDVQLSPRRLTALCFSCFWKTVDERNWHEQKAESTRSTGGDINTPRELAV